MYIYRDANLSVCAVVATALLKIQFLKLDLVMHNGTLSGWEWKKYVLYSMNRLSWLAAKGSFGPKCRELQVLEKENNFI